MVKTSQFQFGIGRLIVLTSAVAVVMAISVRLDAPQFAQWVFAGYLVFFVGWVVMRGPNMYAKLVEARGQRRQLKRRRSELETEAAELRRCNEIVKPVDRADRS